MMIRRPACRMLLILMTATITSCQADTATAPKLPNPAVTKCLGDGWRTEPLLTNGVPTDTVCIHPTTGQRCPAWSYFRGECPPTDPPRNSNSAPASK